MARNSILAPFIALMATAFGSTAAAAEVIVVAMSPGAGVDYTSLPAAVSAAIDGDIILIDSGNYDATAVVGKALTLVARPSTTPTVRGLQVKDLPAFSTMRIAGLALRNKNQTGPSGSGFDVPLRIDDCLGTVLVQDCTMSYATNVVDTDWPGARVIGSTVAFTRCSFRGIEGIMGNEDEGLSGNGGPGLVVRSSRVFLHDCALDGADGGIGDGESGGDGGAALVAKESIVDAFGCKFEGGEGAPGTIYDGLGGSSSAPGYGAAAAMLAQSSTLHHQGCHVRAGSNAYPFIAADPIQSDATSSDFALAGIPALLGANAVTFEQTSATITLQAAPGASVLGFVAAGSQATKFPGVLGALLLSPPLIVFPLGVTNGTGTLQVSAGIPSIAAPIEGVSLGLQLVVVPSGSESPAWSNAHVLVVLDAGP